MRNATGSVPERRAGTRERLLATAEELFATRGIDAVSVRDITEAAGANIAAVNYHFGSRRGLIDAIVERHADALGTPARRAARRARRGRSGRRPCLIRAMVLPTAELATSDPGARYAVSFLTAVGDHPDLMSALDAFAPSTERYLDALARGDAAICPSRSACCGSPSLRVW